MEEGRVEVEDILLPPPAPFLKGEGPIGDDYILPPPPAFDGTHAHHLTHAYFNTNTHVEESEELINEKSLSPPSCRYSEMH